MKKIVYALLSVVLLFSTFQNDKVLATIDDKKQMIVVFKEDVNQYQIEEIVNHVGGKLIEVYEELGVAKVEVSTNSFVELMGHPAVKYVEDDIVITQSVQTQDYGIGATNVPLAWNSGFTGKGIKIAIIDSGVEMHSDLHIVGGFSAVDYTSSYSDDQGHGTHVAGIVSARDNGFGVKGVAYESDIYAVKAFDSKGKAFVSDIIEGIDWAIQNNMDIINLSAGTQTSSYAFQTVIDKAYASGLLIVAAAGNDGTSNGLDDSVDYPARYDSVIGVSAVDSSLNRAIFSSTGPTIEIAAPGVQILSTYTGNQYAYLSGTSMAAPYVTGVLALLKEAYPHLSNSELRSVLIEHTNDIGLTGRDTFYGHGFLQASSFKDPVVFAANNLTRIQLSTNNITGKPSEQVSVSVNAIYDDGKVVDVTNSVTWSSGNTDVATVTNGTVYFKNYGSTTITVSYEGQTAVLQVSIPEPSVVIKVETDKANIVGIPGDFIQVNATAILKNGESKVVTEEATWSSSNVDVAIVVNGLVQFINYGTATITVTYEGFSATSVVNLFNPDSKTIETNFQDITSFFAPAVDYLVQNQITRGLSTTEFGVEKNIIRADAAIWLAKELKLNTGSAKPSGFTDVPSRALPAVNALKEAGIIGGKSETRFGASDPLTRGEVAIILQRAYQLSSTINSSTFTDVSPRYKEAVEALVENKITNGLTTTRFGVSSNITRGQLAVFMYRLAP